MATTTVQSNLVPISLSSDSGSTYKTVVCKKSVNFKGSTSTTKEETDCGVLVGIGANEWSFDVEAIVNTTPASTEFSYEDILGFWSAQTALLVKYQYPTSGTPGGDFYHQGTVYITDLSQANSVGNLLTFSMTLSGTGTLDISA